MNFSITLEIVVTREMNALSELSHLEPGDMVEAMAQGTVDNGQLIVEDCYVEVDGVDVSEWVQGRDLERIAVKAAKEFY